MNRENLRSRIRRAKQARLNEMIRVVDELDSILTVLDDGEGITKDDMARTRELVGRVGQCFHEYNAYRNAEEVFIPRAPSSAGSEHPVPGREVAGSSPAERANVKPERDDFVSNGP